MGKLNIRFLSSLFVTVAFVAPAYGDSENKCNEIENIVDKRACEINGSIIGSIQPASRSVEVKSRESAPTEIIPEIGAERLLKMKVREK
jgi:hypothetical protein